MSRSEVSCFGFGPCFQHSTGQSYKGGQNSRVFRQITCKGPAEIEIRGHASTLGAGKAVQVKANFDVPDERGRRTLPVHVTDEESGLTEQIGAMDSTDK